MPPMAKLVLQKTARISTDVRLRSRIGAWYFESVSTTANETEQSESDNTQHYPSNLLPILHRTTGTPHSDPFPINAAISDISAAYRGRRASCRTSRRRETRAQENNPPTPPISTENTIAPPSGTALGPCVVWPIQTAAKVIAITTTEPYGKNHPNFFRAALEKLSGQISIRVSLSMTSLSIRQVRGRLSVFLYDGFNGLGHSAKLLDGVRSVESRHPHILASQWVIAGPTQ